MTIGGTNQSFIAHPPLLPPEPNWNWLQELWRLASCLLGRPVVLLCRALLLPLQLLFFLGLFRTFAISPFQAIIRLAHRRTSLLMPSRVRGGGWGVERRLCAPVSGRSGVGERR